MPFLPDGATLEEISYKMILIGFLLLSAGIITGSVWAHSAWGTYWSWDPKETWSLITWLVYATLLHARVYERMVGQPGGRAVRGGIRLCFVYLLRRQFSAEWSAQLRLGLSGSLLFYYPMVNIHGGFTRSAKGGAAMLKKFEVIH